MDALDQCIICHCDRFIPVIETKVQMSDGDERFHFVGCEECGLIFLNPRVAPEHLSRYYPSYYLPYRGASAWGRYAELVSKDQVRIDHRRRDHVTRFSPLKAESKVLDLGCGRPTFLQTLYDSYSCRCIGVDFRDEGWKDYAEDFDHLDLRIGEVEALSADLAPDVITMWHYLEHDYRPDRTLAQLRRISKPSTKMIIEVPNHDSLSRRKFGEHWAGYHTPRHTFLFSPETIAQLMEQQGWKVLDIDLKGTLDPYVLYWMSDAEQRNIDWTGSMENEFIRYVKGMLAFRVRQMLSSKKTPWGIMTITAEPR